ncbi:hypothetical protein J2W22_003145 [Sphingomonas kyeonggiensis]|uniref:hypothetical protein n=1 Tax=Sphingomonas kyeonggiensis TaxID=1268553 RepID=UPI002780151E|nr:hypothetical protein [Sphingomonas kyeonggiensis]MDQ0251081.1 hypothetical protein [Sphingomonas kyeonggiensis]
MDDIPTPNPLEDDGPSRLDFIPVPLERVHHNGWTERRQRDFITALVAMGSIRHACRAVGKTRQSAYKLRERPGAESFAAAWDHALATGYCDAFDRALERAQIGIVTPRFYKGKQVGTRHRFDYRLAMAALNGLPPVPPQLRKNIAR